MKKIEWKNLSKIKFFEANSEDIQDHQVEDQDGDLLEVRYLHRDHQDSDKYFSRIKMNKNTRLYVLSLKLILS